MSKLLYWRGRLVYDMDKEELIEVLSELAEMYLLIAGGSTREYHGVVTADKEDLIERIEIIPDDNRN